MKIELHNITVREVVDGYNDSAEEGVVAYSGKLDVRPKYQREFVYKDKQRDAVIKTVRHKFPLNVMYWIENSSGSYELLDGQQRTLSICQYVSGDFSIEDRFFHNLTEEEKEQILDYELMVYFCDGTDKERIEWFEVINTAGEKLTPQELLNAVYTGPWLSDAKLKFSKTNCPAYLLANDGGQLVTGSPIRQDYLETALRWINDGEIADYMAKHQHDKDAIELWNYFQRVIEWVRKTFSTYRKEMSNLPWGFLYNAFQDKKLDSKKLEKQISKLMHDEEILRKPGIYEYVLTGEEKCLNLRTFSPAVKRVAYERQKGICPHCKGTKNKKKRWDITEMEADHTIPWHKGGKTTQENCQLLCLEHNRTKGGR
jgi:hypothetical protein